VYNSTLKKVIVTTNYRAVNIGKSKKNALLAAAIIAWLELDGFQALAMHWIIAALHIADIV
jgi:hypothetical protein